MRSLLAVALLLLVGCTNEPEAPRPPQHCDRQFFVPPSFPANERVAIGRAADRWNALAEEQFCVTTGYGTEPHGIFRVKYRSPEWYRIRDELDGVDWYGVWFGEDDRIAIVDTLSEHLFELVMLHEFGHAHGLRHTDPPAIMHRIVGTANDFTERDIEECRRVEACY